MRRGYTVANYNEIVTKAREAIPSLALSTDILAGFPGEKEEDHAQTARAMEEITFDAAFIFKYSDREGTKAAAMKPKVAQDEIARRHAELLKLQESISLARNRRLIGRPVEVLVEGYSPRKPGRLFGRTRTNKRVAFEGGVDLIGRCVCVTIREVTPLTLIGDSCPVVRDV
jgi:tRNA-2-methylthio-N6-dimethylallyladenosine synthase